jgi:hypothetical protein
MHSVKSGISANFVYISSTLICNGFQVGSISRTKTKDQALVWSFVLVCFVAEQAEYGKSSLAEIARYGFI